MHRVLAIALLLCRSPAAPQRVTPDPRPSPGSCGGGCSTNHSCDVLSSCHYCFGGICTSSLPATPTKDTSHDISHQP